MATLVRDNAVRFLAHALLAGGVLLSATACRNGRLVFFPTSASREPAPEVKVATMATPTPVPTPAPAVAPVAPPVAPPAANMPPPPVASTLPEPAPLPELSSAPELPPVLFASDQYDVDADQKKVLEKHAAFLKANRSVRIVLRGHTDSTASEEYNLALGQKRAESVRQALIAAGVGPDRMETVSFGEALPIKEGDDAPSRAGNRRVEFFLYSVD